MRVAVVTAGAAGRGEAVADFSALLAGGLAAEHDVLLVHAEPAAGPSAVAAKTVPPGWGRDTTTAVERVLEEWQPEVVVAQFVPQLYGWRGAKPFFVLLMRRLARKGIPLITIAHEFNAPWSASPKRLGLALAQRILFRILVRSSRRVVLTTPYACAQIRDRYRGLPAERFVAIPVGATLPVQPLTEEQLRAARAAVGVADGQPVVAMFGSAIPAVAPLVESVLKHVQQISGAVLIVLGRASGSWSGRLRAAFPRLKVVETGPVDAAVLSRDIAMADLVICFYPDGASTRRTSMIAALAHGKTVVSNSGTLTDPDLRASQAFVDFDGSAETMSRLLDPSERSRQGARARAWVDRCCSWPVLIRRYSSLLTEAAAR
jgi:hypothetical protein